MSLLRIYPSKSNTIASGLFENMNSGQNAVSDLWYGGGETYSIKNSLSRHLMYFDLSELQNKFISGEIMSGSVTSYKLRMTNAIPSDVALNTEFSFDRLDKRVATSFDLVVFPINQFWDQGIGYDLIRERYVVQQKGNPVTTGYSNWLSATSVNSWSEPGIFVNPATAVTFSLPTQHFDIGKEDLNIDVTEIVNYWLVSGNTNYGLAVAYRNDYEAMSGNTRYISSFFTSKTNSAFKPFLEVNYNQQIVDDRNQVSNNRMSRLFLYTFSGGQSVNFYSASTVTIKNVSNTPVITGLTPTKLSQGVYYVDVFMSSSTRGQKFYDVWQGITFNPGFDQQDITQSFVISDNYYKNTPSVNDYTLNTYGLENNQIVNGDEKIRVFVIIRVDYEQKGPSPYLSVNYKMTMNNQVEVIPWTPINMAVMHNCQQFYFDVDCSWLLQNQNYRIDFRIDELGSKRVMPQNIMFKVIKKF